MPDPYREGKLQLQAKDRMVSRDLSHLKVTQNRNYFVQGLVKGAQTGL